MSFQKFQPDELFTGHELLGTGYVLITDEQGTVDAIVMEEDAGDNIQRIHGLLSPGFINCHCHLELSHLKNVIPPHTGLIEFLCSVVTKRNFDPAVIQDAIVKAEKEMWDNGIAAVGDIGNTADTADVKSKSKIRWQNFVEVLGFTDEKAQENVEFYRSVLDQMEKIRSRSLSGPNSVPDRHRDRSTLVPHAPYSVSPKTFRLINQLTKDQVISIHNQEHPAEDELYKTGGGDYLKLFKIFGINQSPFPVTGLSSIRSCLPYFNNGQTIFLIHNTYMPEEDITWTNDYAAQHNVKLIYCLCPNTNLYIENKLPPVELFIQHGCQLVLGTDSYSSNWQLSIAKEVQAILAVPRLGSVAPLVEVLRWATINGAKALQWDRDLGSFDKGKTPGGVLIDKNSWTSQRLI